MCREVLTYEWEERVAVVSGAMMMGLYTHHPGGVGQPEQNRMVKHNRVVFLHHHRSNVSLTKPPSVSQLEFSSDFPQFHHACLQQVTSSLLGCLEDA